MDITFTVNHWIYVIVMLIVIFAMLMKRDVVLPCIVGYLPWAPPSTAQSWQGFRPFSMLC